MMFGFLFILMYCMLFNWKLGSDLGSLDKERLSPLDIIRLDSPFQINKGGKCYLLV